MHVVQEHQSIPLSKAVTFRASRLSKIDVLHRDHDSWLECTSLLLGVWNCNPKQFHICHFVPFALHLKPNRREAPDLLQGSLGEHDRV